MATFRYRRPTILRRLPRDRHAVIEASAGTGKTYTLEHLVAELVLRGGHAIEQILVVTFTEKAAGELRTRIRALLQQLLDLRVGDDGVPDADAWDIGDAERALLSRALSGFDGACISTIHSFCQRILTEHAFEQGRLFAQSPVAAEDAFAAAFKDALRGEFATDPALVPWLSAWLAGGKDPDELSGLLLACHRQHARLLPDLDEAALRSALDAFPSAADVEDAIARELKANRMHGGSIKAASTRVREVQELVRTAPALGLPEFLRALDGLRKDRLPKLLAYLAGGGPVAAGLAVAVDRLASAAPPYPAVVVARLLPKVRERLVRTKREAGQFDFDDMLQLVRAALCSDGGDPLAALLRDRFHVALIDEFQDTDEVQWAIFRRLFFEAPDRPLFVIGDPKQAIYAFRGADVRTYLDARRTLLDAGGGLVALDRNFRSTGRLIEGYNAVLDQRADPPYFEGEITYDAPVTCGDPSRRALAPDGADAVPLHLFRCVSSRPDAKPAEAGAPLADRIAAEAARLLTPGSFAPLRLVEDGATRALRPKDLYVLVADRFGGRVVADALRRHGIACVRRDAGLFEAPEAAELRAVLAAVQSPDDRGRLARAFLSPFFGVTLDELAGCWELAPDDPRRQLLLRWKQLADRHDLAGLLRAVVDDSGVLRRLLLRPDGERALTNLQHLTELLLEQAAQRRLSLGELLRTFDAFLDDRDRPDDADDAWQQRLESERDAVQVMTMHLSKGLEAPVVFVHPRLGARRGDTLFRHHDASGARACWIGPPPPDVERASREEQEAENARVHYVALTRAKVRLYLPYFGPAPAGADPGLFPVAAPEGAWARVNRRLCALAAEGRLAAAGLVTFDAVSVDAPAPLSRPPAAVGNAVAWQPPPALLADSDDGDRFAAARHRSAPLVVTSYSRLKSERAAADAAEEPREEAHREPAPAGPLPESVLPGGAKVGTFLHEIIEHLDFAEVSACPELAAFHAHPGIVRVAAAAAVRHEIDPRHLPEARRLVHLTLTSPVLLEPGRPPVVFSRVTREARELEFLYPFPEPAHPPFPEPWPGARVELRRGYVKGFVDFVFEHEGRAWFADWKSDALASFAPEAVAAHVDGHYQLQVRLYVLALVKLLGLRTQADYDARFGGIVYVFLRGLAPDPAGSPGIDVRRPSFAEILAWEAAFARDGFAGPGPAAGAA